MFRESERYLLRAATSADWSNNVFATWATLAASARRIRVTRTLVTQPPGLTLRLPLTIPDALR
jgi:hypothetical protein